MSTVHLEDLGAIDLNLLVAFDAIARERSVTRAAEQLGVTQSAMSHTLRRLRELLGDPLLVRGRGGMLLTPRAEALVVPLRSGLVALASAIAKPASFDPARSQRAFRIAAPDIFDSLILPPLLEHLQRAAPGVDLAFLPLDEHLNDRLETGELDVGVVVLPQIEDLPAEALAQTSPGLQRRTIVRDDFVCFVRAGHPELPGGRSKRALTLDLFLSLSHAMVSTSGAGPGLVDRYLEKKGLRRRIALRIQTFHSAAAIIAKSDLILTGPTALLSLPFAGEQLRAFPPPLPLPGHTINLVWHERFSEDAAHRWLRNLLAQIAGALPAAKARDLLRSSRWPSKRDRKTRSAPSSTRK